jgi:hypothetical protein
MVIIDEKLGALSNQSATNNTYHHSKGRTVNSTATISPMKHSNGSDLGNCPQAGRWQRECSSTIS